MADSTTSMPAGMNNEAMHMGTKPGLPTAFSSHLHTRPCLPVSKPTDVVPPLKPVACPPILTQFLFATDGSSMAPLTSTFIFSSAPTCIKVAWHGWRFVLH